MFSDCSRFSFVSWIKEDWHWCWQLACNSFRILVHMFWDMHFFRMVYIWSIRTNTHASLYISCLNELFHSQVLLRVAQTVLCSWLNIWDAFHLNYFVLSVWKCLINVSNNKWYLCLIFLFEWLPFPSHGLVRRLIKTWTGFLNRKLQGLPVKYRWSHASLWASLGFLPL